MIPSTNYWLDARESCEYTIPAALDKMYREWTKENNRQPLYFVINPDDYAIVYGEYCMCASAKEMDYKIFGILVLISQIVPRGEFKFVG